jgi:heme exporter protein A
LSVRDLEISQGDRTLFSGLTFELGAGELATVTGPNGAGKTTLLRTLAGLRQPAAGEATLDGTPVDVVARGLTAPMAYQGHSDALKRDLTLVENLRFCEALWGSSADIEVLAAELRLTPCLGQRVRHLSAGQRRRAALACLWIKRAALWLLDEPLTNLDTLGAELVNAWISSHLQAGGAAVVATHQPERFVARARLEIDL